MTETMIWEIIGYVGSALVLISLLMSSIVKLRIINGIGSLIFCIYAFKIHSIPTAVMNVCLVAIDLYYLYKIMVTEKVFTSAVVSKNDITLNHILDIYKVDIEKYFGSNDISKADKIIVVFDKETIAGVTAGVTKGDSLEIILDYSTSQYRDCKVGKYIINLLKSDYKHLVYTGDNPNHTPYLSKVGYVKKDGVYVLDLK